MDVRVDNGQIWSQEWFNFTMEILQEPPPLDSTAVRPKDPNNHSDTETGTLSLVYGRDNKMKWGIP